jgi:hypothetical protein
VHHENGKEKRQQHAWHEAKAAKAGDGILVNLAFVRYVVELALLAKVDDLWYHEKTADMLTTKAIIMTIS